MADNKTTIGVVEDLRRAKAEGAGTLCDDAINEIEQLRAACRSALAAFRLRGGDDSLLEAIGRAAQILTAALHP